MLYKIGFFCLFCASLFGAEHVYLKTPTISQQSIIGTTAGIRPFRKTGVRLEAELVRDKLIIHNYGYGGSGLTLSLAGSREVLEILDHQKTSVKSIAVLGAGAVGLAAAYDLLERGYEVHLYADQWSPNLTSNVAAGIWTPLSYPKDLPEDKKKLHQRLLETAEHRFSKSTGLHPEFAGVKLIASYSFESDTDQGANKHLGEEVTVHFDNGIIKTGIREYELGIDGKVFMEDLYAKVKSKGAVLKQKHFESLEDVLALNEPVIINCLSLGSRELFNDQEFIPIRGQLIYLKPQEGIDYLLFQRAPNKANKWVAIYFSLYGLSDKIVLGGVYERDQEELRINPEAIDEIIQNAEKFFAGT